MGTKGRFILAAAVAVLATVTWVLLRPGSGERPSLPAPAPAALPSKPAVPSGREAAAEPASAPAGAARPEGPPEEATPSDPAAGAPGTTNIAGTVLDANGGAPIAGAQVIVIAGNAEGPAGGAAPPASTPPLGSATTDSEGRFRIDGIALGEGVTIRASAPGFGPKSESLSLRPGKEAPLSCHVTLELPGSGVLRGFVFLPDGKPAAGATVHAFTEWEWEFRNIDPTSAPRHRPDLAGTTGPDGAYEVTGLAIDTGYMAMAVLADVGRSRPVRELLPTAGTPVVPADFRILEAGMVRVRVLLPDGSPCRGAFVGLRPGYGRPLTEEEPGLYVIRKGFTGSLVVEVSMENWIPARTHVEVPEIGDTSLDVRIEKGVAVAGTVTDDAGRPLADVRVFVGRPPGTEGRLPPSRGGTWTDSEGRFRIEGLRDGIHLVELPDRKDERAADGADDGLRVNAPAEDMRIVMPRVGSVLLRLVVPPGVELPEEVSTWIEREPEGGTEGRVDLAGPRLPWYRRQHIVWIDGEIEVKVAGGVPVRVVVDAPGFARLRKSAVAPAGGTVDLGEVLLDPGLDGGGRVVDGAGEPVEGATISFGVERSAGQAAITTDENGNFVVPHFPRGRTDFTVSAVGFVPTTATLESPASGPVVVTLRRGARLTVRVLDAEGAPAVGTRVRWTRPGGGVGDADSEETGPGGIVEFRLPAGRCAVALLDERWNPVADAAKEVELVEGGASIVELRLPRR